VTGGTGGSGSANAATTSNGTDGQATNATNQQNVVYNYVYNGTTWDRSRGTGGAANVLAGLYSTSLPTMTSGVPGAIAVDINGRIIQAPGASVTVSNFPASQAVTNAGTFAVQNTAATPAGTNIIGRVGIDQTTPGTTNSVVVNSSAADYGTTPASTNGTIIQVKGSAANLYGFSLTQGATAGFFAFLNVATTPTSGAAISPSECVPVAVNSYVARRQDIPDRYPNGLVVVSTSSCTTYTAVTPTLMSFVAR
jgi:hypothetical protein